MAFVGPIFFLFVLGTIEFTRGMMVQSLLTNAAHLGCRAGILDGAQQSDVTTAVNNYLSAGGISTSKVQTTVTPDPPSSATYGQTVTVSVTVPYSSVSWLPNPRWLASATLGATSVMRRETVQ